VGLEFDRGLCERCGTYDCLTKCQYLRLDREGARREMAKNVIAVLGAASVSFGVLGNEEECDGNEAYMLGGSGSSKSWPLETRRSSRSWGSRRY